MDWYSYFIGVIAGGLAIFIVYEIAVPIARRANSVQSVVRPPDAGRDLNPARSPDRRIIAKVVDIVEGKRSYYHTCGCEDEFDVGALYALDMMLMRLEELDKGEGALERQDAVEKS